jgi:tRNA(fMet)-specific endonuclease VapC
MTFLDTSVIIDFLSGDEKIVSLMKDLVAKEQIKTTTITEYELLKYKSEIRRHAAETFLSGVTVCPFDSASAKKAASLYEKLKETGKMVNESDLLIAGISLANNEVLLTRDKKFANLNEEKIQII